MLFMSQFFIGGALVVLGWALWYAKRNSTFRTWIESTFLDDGDGLFDTDKPYTSYVKWGRYVAFWAGSAILVPTRIMWDIVLGMAALGVFWWMNRQKVAHDDAVVKKVVAKAEA